MKNYCGLRFTVEEVHGSSVQLMAGINTPVRWPFTKDMLWKLPVPPIKGGDLVEIRGWDEVKNVNPVDTLYLTKLDMKRHCGCQRHVTGIHDKGIKLKGIEGLWPVEALIRVCGNEL